MPDLKGDDGQYVNTRRAGLRCGGAFNRDALRRYVCPPFAAQRARQAQKAQCDGHTFIFIFCLGCRSPCRSTATKHRNSSVVDLTVDVPDALLPLLVGADGSKLRDNGVSASFEKRSGRSAKGPNDAGDSISDGSKLTAIRSGASALRKKLRRRIGEVGGQQVANKQGAVGGQQVLGVSGKLRRGGGKQRRGAL
jgi:hypothetical protein